MHYILLTRRVILHPRVRATIVHAALQRYPREACGLLLGTRDQWNVYIALAEETPNVSPDPRGFAICPSDHDRLAGGAPRGLQVWGIFHAHHHAFYPSTHDVLNMREHGLLSLIAGNAALGLAERIELGCFEARGPRSWRSVPLEVLPP